MVIAEPKTKYGITKSTSGFIDFIEITGIDFTDIKSARNKFFEVLYIEEKFDLVIENYLEYETELLALTTRNMLHQNHDYFQFQDV